MAEKSSSSIISGVVVVTIICLQEALFNRHVHCSDSIYRAVIAVIVSVVEL